MAKAWYSCKVKYQKIDQHGNQVKAADTYLIEAISYTDAETRLYEIMEQLISVDFQVVAISKANFEDIINSEEGFDWYKIKASAISYDEESGKEKKISSYYLISAEDIQASLEHINDYFKESIHDYTVLSVAITTINDVFPFDEVGDSLPVDQYQAAPPTPMMANASFEEDDDRPLDEVELEEETEDENEVTAEVQVEDEDTEAYTDEEEEKE